jgi:hypothetical protein
MHINRKTIFCLLFILVLSVSFIEAKSFAPVWDSFYELASAGEPEIFPKIIIPDRSISPPELLKADTNLDSTVTIYEYFDYHEVPRYITVFILSIDKDSAGTARPLYAHVLNNLAYVESRLGTVTASNIFNLYFDYYGIPGLASTNSSSDIMTFLDRGIFKLPGYMQRPFFDRYSSIMEIDNDALKFQSNYFALTSFFIDMYTLGLLSEESANDIMNDIDKVSSVMRDYPIEELLGLYQVLSGLYFPANSQSKASNTLNAIKTIIDISKGLKDIARTLTQSPQNLFATAMEGLSNLLDTMSQEQKHELVSEDWELWLRFLINKKQVSRDERLSILGGLNELARSKTYYFAIRADLELYLNSFFVLQYTTSLSLKRIVYLFNETSLGFPASIVQSVGDILSRNEDFVFSNSDAEILKLITLAEQKTRSIFGSSFDYAVRQSDGHPLTLDKIITVYQTLTPGDLSFLVTENITLRFFNRVIEDYKPTLDYHLPLFARIYIESGRSNLALDIINGSFDFHSMLTIEDIETLKSRLSSHFYPDFLSLLDVSRESPRAFLPLSESRKSQLFRYSEITELYNINFEVFLRFGVTIYAENFLSESPMKTVEEIVKYLGSDKESNKRFSDYFLSIIEKLNVEYDVFPLADLAFTVIDIYKATGYSHQEVARILQKNVEVFQEPAVLQSTRDISRIFDSSPDVFITFDMIDLAFSEENLAATQSFLSRQQPSAELAGEVFIYALRRINTLFAVNEVYDDEMLQVVSDVLTNLSVEKRKTIFSALSQISFLRQLIDSPESLENSIPVLSEIDSLNSDIFDMYLLKTIPAFDSVIDNINDYKDLFRNLESINKSVSVLSSFMEGRTARENYFSETIPRYTAWATSPDSVLEIHDAMVSPLVIWKSGAETYFAHLKTTFTAVVVPETSADISVGFAILSSVLAAAHNQLDFAVSLRGLSSNFFSSNTIPQFMQFFLDVESNKVAIEYAKSSYFTGTIDSDMEALDTLLNNYFKKKYVVRQMVSPFALYDTAQNFDTLPEIIGGRIDFAFPFTKNFQSFTEPQFLASLGYLFLLNSYEHEGNISIGLLLPFLHTGLSRSVDFHLFFSGNFGLTLAISADNVSQKGIVAFADFGLAFNIRRKIRLGFGATIMRTSWIGEDVAIKGLRIGATILFTSL